MIRRASPENSHAGKKSREVVGVGTINQKNFAMAECKQEVFEFQAHGSRKVTADFSGGYLSSDGGAVFLRGVDLRMGLIERLAGCFSDYRLPCLVEHKVAELLRQRIGEESFEQGPPGAELSPFFH